jgi:hypothetical protein
MRKLIALAALAALVSAPAALAKERNIALMGVPAAPTAGKAFTVTISVTRDKQPAAGKAPIVRLLSSSVSVINITARETEKIGVYRARIVFPRAGMWRVVVIDRMTGRAYPFGRMRVRAT